MTISTPPENIGENIALLDAALGVFMRYGFRRTTMSDIAKAAGLSRQSLYARFANKHEIYAAGLLLYSARTLETLQTAWADAQTLGDAMDALFDHSIRPTFDMLRQSPDAADMIEAAESPEGRVAMAQAAAQKCARLETLFAPYEKALGLGGVTPASLAEFVENNKHTMIQNARNADHLAEQFGTLKASVLALTRAN